MRVVRWNFISQTLWNEYRETALTDVWNLDVYDM